MSEKHELKQGIITKGVSGFYYVEIDKKIYECKARGLLKQQGIKPLAGDNVTVSIDKNNTNTIQNILERKSALQRPAVANIDNLLIITSVCDPKPNLLMIDKLIAISIKNNIKPIVIISKSDLKNPKEILNVYKQAGIDIYSFSVYSEKNADKIKTIFLNGISALAGNSGVGKSSLLNYFFPELELKTGTISKKLGRGKHTTREVELFKISNDAYIIDSPGFSSFDLTKNGIDSNDKIENLFPEFSTYIDKCKFTSCSHTCEEACKIIQAVKSGKINKHRYNSYVAIYKELEEIKKW